MRWRWISGDFSIEAGLTLDNLPKITFKYEHTFREGEESSTHLGIHPSCGGSLGARAQPLDL